MATSEFLHFDVKGENEEDKQTDEYKQLISSLPTEKTWNSLPSYQYQNFWYLPIELQGAINFQKYIKARDDDVLLVTLPKSGTTWLKALAFAIVNRGQCTIAQHPLLTNNPQRLLPRVEIVLSKSDGIDYINNLGSPRLLPTHIPYCSLPESFKEMDCRIVYLCRNPRDSFISLWNFINKLRPKSDEPLPLEEALEMFCRGSNMFGPYWDHVLGHWNESLKRPEKVLFLKYEEMKGDTIAVLKKLANFLGCPFSSEEESQGKVEEIVSLCSFENLSNLEVNKSGITMMGKTNDIFFRKGAVGDWANYFTPRMTEMMIGAIEEKLQGSGLMFQY